MTADVEMPQELYRLLAEQICSAEHPEKEAT